MSDEQFKFPPGMKPRSYWLGHPARPHVIEAIQRDAVTAARREVEVSLAAKGRSLFGDRLTLLLNEFSAEGPSNTPDFILAEYLQNCLSAFNGAQQRRQQHFEQPKAYDKCNCTGTKTYYWRCNTRCCFHCNKPLRVQSV